MKDGVASSCELRKLEGVKLEQNIERFSACVPPRFYFILFYFCFNFFCKTEAKSCVLLRFTNSEKQGFWFGAVKRV